jgi:hypothetical protein
MLACTLVLMMQDTRETCADSKYTRISSAVVNKVVSAIGAVCTHHNCTPHTLLCTCCMHVVPTNLAAAQYYHRQVNSELHSHYFTILHCSMRHKPQCICDNHSTLAVCLCCQSVCNPEGRRRPVTFQISPHRRLQAKRLAMLIHVYGGAYNKPEHTSVRSR